MRRKKQFVALSLAAVLAWGGVCPVSSPIGSVHAEEVQTELSAGTPADDITSPSTETPADDAATPSTETPADDTTSPSTETPADDTTSPSTETPADDTTAPSTETPADDTTSPSTEAPVDDTTAPSTGTSTDEPADPSIVPSEEPVTGDLPEGETPEQTDPAGGINADNAMDGVENGTVSGGNPSLSTPGMYTTKSANTVSEVVDITGGFTAGQTYGDDVVQFSVPTDMNYTAGSSKVVNGITCDGWLRDPSKNGNVTLGADGSVTAEGVIAVTAAQDAQVSFIVQKAATKAIHFQHVEDGQLVDFYEEETLVPDNAMYTYDIEAGKTYYFYISGSRMSVGYVAYSYEKEKEPVPMVTKTVVVDILTNGMTAGTDYGKTDVIEIIPSHDMKVPEGKSGYLQAFDGTAAVNGGLTLGDDGNPVKKGLIEIKALQDGCKVIIDIKASSNKNAYLKYVEGGVIKDALEEAFAKDEPYELELQKDVTYYFYVGGSKMSLEGLSYSYLEEKTTPDVDLVDGVLAFPTAEGGGRLATGGRGGDVYVVTNLNDSGEGSLRYGIQTAPDTGRIIVFNVGGTIHLESTLTFKDKQNITIAGQTAPGDGITVAGYDTNISDSKNIIIRFVRFRVGTENLLKGGDSMDALWGRDNENFIIDHCTFSWNTDETLSTYRGKDGTVQWCLISESLTVSGHSKGRHGYGGIFGGDNTVFQYNLMTNHTSRNPRIGGGTMGDPTTIDWDTYQAMTDAEKAEVQKRIATLQLSNNVLYNHGYFACYGGGWTYTNYIYNYVKPGQGTRDALSNTLLGFGEKGKLGGIYYANNVLEGNDAVTADNSKGFSADGGDFTTVSSTPYQAEAFDHITLTTDTDTYYHQVLNSAGATYPHRDAIDARVVAQVETDTGTYINTQDEVGGFPAETCVSELEDSDHDGIPDDWEREHGLDPADPDDSRTLCLEDPKDVSTYGYAWIEVYFNELVGENSKPDYVAENPTVTIDLADNKLLDQGESITVTATATSSKGIEKVEFYNGATLVGTADSAPYQWTYSADPDVDGSIAADGTYHISVRAYDNDGNKTQSDTARLHVNSTAGIGEWSQTDIGNPEVAGTASLVDGVLTVKGAGKIGASEGSNRNVRPELANSADDDFHFVYQEMTGDIEIVTRFDSYVPVDNHTFQGLMFRNSLEEDAAMVALGFTMVKVDETTIWSAFMVNRETDGGKVQNISETIDSPEAAEKAGIPLIANLPFKEGNDYLGTWLKLSREGDTFIGSVSSDGLVWQKIGELTVDLGDTAYVGFAVEANRAGNDLINYGSAKFSNIEVNESFANITYDTENVTVAGADKLALGKDLAVTFSKVTGFELPESVEVTIGGKPAVQGVDYTYSAETGLLQITNVQADVAITAYGVKRVVLPVEYEVIDENDLLEITDSFGKLVLTQKATEGNMQTTNKDTGVQKDASNVSYLLFPEVDEYHELSMNVTVKSMTSIGKGDETGFFLGAFAADGSGVYTAFGFRANMVGKGYWYKPGGTAGKYTGDGNPGITTGSDTVYALDTTYQIVFKTNGKGGYNAVVTWPGGSITKEFKAGESVIETGDVIRYGMAIVGATVEIGDMKLVDPEGNVIYNQNSADYSKVIAAIEKASSLNPADYVDFSAVEAAWDAVELGLDASHQEEVDAMAKAIEDAIAQLQKKPEETPEPSPSPSPDPGETPEPSPEPGTTPSPSPGPGTTPSPSPEPGTTPSPSPAPEQNLVAVPSETIPETVLTEAVKNATGCSTVEALTNYMRDTVVKAAFADASHVVWDVTLRVRTNNNGWRDATEADVPAEGILITLPYPSEEIRAARDEYEFTVSHLITQNWNNQTIGQVDEYFERINLDKTEDGLVIRVWSASPFAIAYKRIQDPAPTTTPDQDDSDNGDDDSSDNGPVDVSQNVTTQAVKTGDNMNVAVIVWSIVLVAAAAGAGVLVYRRRRGADGNKSE